eukprot:scaffold6811_cov126-Isochrysis_galbana.AAC.8
MAAVVCNRCCWVVDQRCWVVDQRLRRADWDGASVACSCSDGSARKPVVRGQKDRLAAGDEEHTG